MHTRSSAEILRPGKHFVIGDYEPKVLHLYRVRQKEGQ
jgi:hypothetical protein